MKTRLLRTVLTWLAPIVIGLVVKKFEERQNKKNQSPKLPNQ